MIKGRAIPLASAWPIISREMRAEARHRSTYLLRWLGAAGLTVLFGALMRDQLVSATLSIRLFTSAHTVMLAAIWLIGPALTADAISRERREGTLNLLFSTSLDVRSVIFGKGFVHMARLITVWWAGFPIVTTAVLLGGVSKLDIISAFLLELCAALWALGAGLVSSCLVKSATGAFLLAEAFALGLSQLFRVLLAQVWLLQSGLFGASAAQSSGGIAFHDLSLALCTGIGIPPGWSNRADPFWPLVLVEAVLASLGGFCLLLLLATWRTRRLRQEEPLSARQIRRRQLWLAPRFWLKTFAQRRQRALDRDPLTWLSQQSTWVRASKLGWCGLVLFVDSLVILSRHPWEHFETSQLWLSLLLSGTMAFVAVLMFRREGTRGMLELLLVTPLSVNQIIFRQARAFWARFYLPLLLLLGLAELMVWLDLGQSIFNYRSFLVVNFLTIPLIGFYASASFRSFSAAFLLTAFFALGLPLLWPEIGPGFMDRVADMDLWFLSAWPSPPANPTLPEAIIPFVQIFAAAGSWLGLEAALTHRSFHLRQFA